MGTKTIDISWLCIVGVIVIMIPVIYFSIHSRSKYAKQLLKTSTWSSKSMNSKPQTRFTSLDEYYKAINSLIDWLRREGHSLDAQKLDRLMHTAWTTGSELLGELMLALKSMKSNYSPELRQEINECYEFALHYRKS